MDQALFEHFAAAKALGDRRLATSKLAEFIASFESEEERRNWTRWYLDGRVEGHTIRYEIFEHIVFPVLQAGYSADEPWALQMLERWAQSLYRAPHLWAQVDHTCVAGFAKRRLALDPDNELAKADVLKHMLADFGYAVHEWPAGILCGVNGATLGQCDEILLSIEQARALDQAGAHKTWLDEFEAKVLSYIDRLQNRTAIRPRT